MSEENDELTLDKNSMEYLCEHIINHVENNFLKLYKNMASTIEIDFTTKAEFNLAKGLLDRQVSQANSVFMIADKCENYCRDIEKQFQDIREQFACTCFNLIIQNLYLSILNDLSLFLVKPDIKTLLKVESNFHNYTKLAEFNALK